jgi:hypothetical protein
VPEPYEQEKVLGSVNVNTKIVVLEESETEGVEPTETILLEKSILVTSSSRTTLMLRDLFNCLDEDGHIPADFTGAKFKSISNYEANDTHMWYWSLNGNPDLGDRASLAEGDNVVLTYAKKGAELNTDDDGNVLTMTVNLTIKAGAETIYSGDYTVEGEKSISVKDLLKRLRDEDGAFDVSVAGSIKSINDYKSNETNVWKITVDDDEVKPSYKAKDTAVIVITYEAKA